MMCDVTEAGSVYTNQKLISLSSSFMVPGQAHCWPSHRGGNEMQPDPRVLSAVQGRSIQFTSSVQSILIQSMKYAWSTSSQASS